MGDVGGCGGGCGGVEVGWVCGVGVRVGRGWGVFRFSFVAVLV